MLLSRQILNGSQDFFFSLTLFIYFLKYETRAFLTLIILAIGTYVFMPTWLRNQDKLMKYGEGLLKIDQTRLPFDISPTMRRNLPKTLDQLIFSKFY